MNRRVLVAGLVVAFPLVVFLGLAFRSDPKVIESPLVGRPAPAFRSVDIEARPIGSDDFAGRPMLINFWSTYCVPCVAEHEVLQAMSRRYGDRVAFIGVVYQDRPEAIRAFLDRRGTWGVTVVDPDVRVAISYGVYGVPESFLVDRQGRIARKFTGPMEPDELDRALRAVI